MFLIKSINRLSSDDQDARTILSNNAYDESDRNDW